MAIFMVLSVGRLWPDQSREISDSKWEEASLVMDYGSVQFIKDTMVCFIVKVAYWKASSSVDY